MEVFVNPGNSAFQTTLNSGSPLKYGVNYFQSTEK